MDNLLDYLKGFTVDDVEREWTTNLPLLHVAPKCGCHKALDLFGVNIKRYATMSIFVGSLCNEKVDAVRLINSRFTNVDGNLSDPPFDLAGTL